VLSLPLLVLAWGLGLNLSLGRLAWPSSGAVDNGAACAVLAGLADRLARGEVSLRRTAATLAFFTGEEANMQGSAAYVRSRAWPLPVVAVNLEVLGQDGGYIYWERDGRGFWPLPTAAAVTAALAEAVREVTGELPQPAGPVNSDAASFLAAGIPTAVLGTRDRVLGLGGFHRPTEPGSHGAAAGGSRNPSALRPARRRRRMGRRPPPLHVAADCGLPAGGQPHGRQHSLSQVLGRDAWRFDGPLPIRGRKAVGQCLAS